VNVDELLDEIDDRFDGVPQHVSNSSRVEDLYEAFLMGLMLEAARRIDPSAVSWHAVDGSPAPDAVLRASPGQIYQRPFTHAKLTFAGSAVYEVHLGVMVQGAHAAHECDVVALRAGVAGARRGNASMPSWQDLVLVLEAKAYERAPGLT
jgi:hypothetical protein